MEEYIARLYNFRSGIILPLPLGFSYFGGFVDMHLAVFISIIIFLSLFLFTASCQEINAIINVTKKDRSIDKLLSVFINTDRSSYVEGQPIKVSGKVLSNSGQPINSTVIIEMKRYSEIIYRSAIYSPNGTFGFTISSDGKAFGVGSTYSLTATALANGTGEVALETIQIQQLFLTRPLVMIYIGGFGGFIALIIVIRRRQLLVTLGSNLRNKLESLPEKFGINSVSDQGTEQGSKQLELDEARKHDYFQEKEKFQEDLAHLMTRIYSTEIYRFVCLSIIAGTPIAAFALTDVEITPNSPIGLVIKPTTQTAVSFPFNNNTMPGGEWVVNIGGNPVNRYTSGIQVPVGVFIFGIAGGYLRYLYETAENIQQRRKSLKVEYTTLILSEEIQVLQASRVFYESLRDIALFFLSPLLSIALWLVLIQGGTTSSFTLAAVSFTIGLVTREVIDALIGFARGILSSLKQERSNDRKVLSTSE